MHFGLYSTFFKENLALPLAYRKNLPNFVAVELKTDSLM